MNIQRILNNMLYTFTGRITWKEAHKLNNYVAKYLPRIEYLMIQDVVDITKEELEGEISREVYEKIHFAVIDRLVTHLQKLENDVKIPSKYFNFIHHNMIIFYPNLTVYNEVDGERVRCAIQYMRPSSKALMGLDWNYIVDRTQFDTMSIFR